MLSLVLIFDDNIRLCLEILQPVDIVAAQSDDLPLSRVYFLSDSIGSKLTARNCRSRKKLFTEVVAHYWNFLYHDSTGIAYLLDPNYFGEKFFLIGHEGRRR